LSGGEYQSVTNDPVSGSCEAKVTKFSVSRAACHKIGLTVLPVCGPICLCDSFLAKPRIVQIDASVSISEGSLVDACCALAAAGGALDWVSAHAPSANERLAAKAAGKR